VLRCPLEGLGAAQRSRFASPVGHKNQVIACSNPFYKFTTQGARSTFAKGVALSKTLSYVAFQPMPVCCQ
jgi:hypothetical protein